MYEWSRRVSGGNGLSPHWWQRQLMVSFVLSPLLGELKPLEVVLRRNEVLAFRESRIQGRWEIPLINLSLALSEIMSACHKSAILFSKTPYNPELDKQHFYQMHEVLASGN